MGSEATVPSDDVKRARRPLLLAPMLAQGASVLGAGRRLLW
jgi:hypothetical protein